MDASSSPLQPDSTIPADRTADTGQAPDTTPEAMQELYGQIKARYFAHLEDPLLVGIVSAVLEGRAARAAEVEL